MWNLDQHLATFGGPQLQMCINLQRPMDGLQELILPTGPLRTPCLLWGLDVEATSLQDAYVRGDDLIATYAETDTQPCTVQVYWRVVTVSKELSLLELILSVHTSKLDGDPRTVLRSRLPTKDLACGSDFVWAGLQEPPLHVCEMAHPSNLGEAQQQLEGEELLLLRSFFPGRLEKGVIRRARLRLAFALEREVARAEQLRAEFVASEPPLTT